MSQGSAIFLSYASQDADAARRICDALRAAGLEVWFDQSELRGGDAWDQSIRKQIKECALFVPIISANTNAREEGYFRREWNLAVNRTLDMADHKAFLLPVLLEGATEKDALVPDKFRERQWSKLTTAEAIANFAQRAAKLLDGRAFSVESSPKVVPASELALAIPQPISDDTPSIAVLAFANRSASTDDEYFSDGLADELLNVLAKIRGLRVAAQTSAFSFKGKSTTISDIGRALNVATVLEGSVRKSGNRVRVSVQLVKVADGYRLWSETYDRTLDDIFAVQDDIAQSVVKELHSLLMASSHPDAASAALDLASEDLAAAALLGRTANSEAQRLYMEGRFLLRRRSADDVRQSIHFFQEAVALDPHFAMAWASLAQAKHDATGVGLAAVEVGNLQAISAAEKAKELAPDLADAYMALAQIQLNFQYDWAGAQASIERALELAPNNSDGLTVASRLQFGLGNLDRSVSLGERAIALDPLNVSPLRTLALAHFSAGNDEAAVRMLRRSLELAPDAVASRHLLSMILGCQGDFEAALAEISQENAEWAQLTSNSLVRWLMNQPEESDRALTKLIEKHGHDSAVQISFLYAMRGAKDDAFAWLERAYVQRDGGLVLIKPAHFYKPLHDDPRWPAFLKKLGLPD